MTMTAQIGGTGLEGQIAFEALPFYGLPEDAPAMHHTRRQPQQPIRAWLFKTAEFPQPLR